MDNFAPVLIPTLNRHIHFKRCVESLSKCTHAEKTDLFIALDYPLSESHWEGYETIKTYLPKIKGFKSIQIIKRQKNFGASENIQCARKMIFETYDRIILSEDDNEFSPYFLQYMNDGLEFFRDNKKIVAINGYNIPTTSINDYSYEYYLSKYFSCWGYATWADRNCCEMIENKDAYKEIKNDRKLLKKIKSYHPKLINSLKQIHEGKLIAGDYMITFHLIKNDLFTIKPIKSLVKNIGHDGSGLHCGISDKFNADPYNKRINIINSELPKYDENYDKQYYFYFNPKFHLLDRLKNKFKKYGILHTYFTLFERMPCLKKFFPKGGWF